MAPINIRTRTRLSPAHRKQQLLGYALDAFAKRGIGRAGHADVAEMADVSVATVFNYFSTREELVDAVLKETLYEFKRLIDRNMAGNPDLSVALIDISQALIDAALDETDWLKIWFEWSTSLRDDIWPAYINGKKAVFSPYYPLFETSRPITDKHTVENIIGLFEGICYVLYLQSYQQPNREKLRQQAHRYIHMICH